MPSSRPSRARSALAAAAALVAAFVLGTLWGARGSPRAPPEGPAAARPAAEEPEAPAAPTLRPRDRVPAHPSRDAGRAPAPTERAESAEPTEPAGAPVPVASPEEFPVLEVLVVQGDGAPAGGANVYALVAGASGVDEDPASQATADGEGLCRLPLPAPGRYDVGVLNGAAGQALATDVTVPSSAPLRLELAPLARVVFEVDPDVTAHLKPGQPLQLGAELVSQRPRYGYPGRGQDRHVNFVVAARGSFETLLPAGRRFRASASGPAVRAIPVPAEFTPPDTVRFRAPTYVRLSARFLPPERSSPWPAWIPVRFDFGPANGAPQERSYGLAAGQALGSLPAVRWDFGGIAESGIVRWSGAGVRDGEARFEAATAPYAPDDAGTPIEITVTEIQAAGADGPEDDRPASAIRILASSLPRGTDTVVDVATDAGDGSSISAEDVQKGATLGFETDWSFAIARAGDHWVGGPVRRRGALTEIALREGGYLVLVPERMPPEAIGAPQLTRVDGGPCLSPDDGFEPHVRVAPGRVLGPFEPGEVVFSITLGGLPAGEVRAVVTAGEHRALRFAPFRPLSSR
jgi:hypothetical protein